MKSRPISTYILFGTELRYLTDAGEGWEVHGEDLILDNIDRFFANLAEFDLPVTQRAACHLDKLRHTFAELPSDYRLTLAEASELSDIMEDLRNTLFAEAEGNVAFIVTDKRIDVNKLLSDMPALMAPGVFDALPEIAQYDFTEAGKCIAFERPTAAAFHIVRGTEATLKHFYCSVVKRNRAQLMWGPIVKSLKDRKSKRPSDALLDNLDSIRRSFRNPTQHPEKTYDIQDVQDLFARCIDVVNRMVASEHWESPRISQQPWVSQSSDSKKLSVISKTGTKGEPDQ